MGEEDNFWASGPTGPCGPCSELYYDLHPERGMDASIDLDDDSRFIEFYNLVFMELNRDASGNLAPLANKNIDTGMGLERMAQILQGVPNNYETDLIKPIMDVAASLAGECAIASGAPPSLPQRMPPPTRRIPPTILPPQIMLCPAAWRGMQGTCNYELCAEKDACVAATARLCCCNNLPVLLQQPASVLPTLPRAAGAKYADMDADGKTSFKVIADHTRAVVYMLSDGVVPSNVGRGYVARRLLRRVVLKGRLLGISEPFVAAVADAAIKLSPECDPAVEKHRQRVLDEISREEERFLATITAGENMLEKLLSKAEAAGGLVTGEDAFLMYDTFGFPLELTQEVAAARGLTVEEKGFEVAMQEQRARSKVCEARVVTSSDEAPSEARCCVPVDVRRGAVLEWESVWLTLDHASHSGNAMQDAREEVDLTADAALAELASRTGATEFTGYEELMLHGAQVVQIIVDGNAVTSCSEGQQIEVVLAKTPFYAEAGGQIGDTGILKVLQAAEHRTINRIRTRWRFYLSLRRCTGNHGRLRPCAGVLRGDCTSA
jgi:alanyl-tRNA synthetase